MSICELPFQRLKLHAERELDHPRTADRATRGPNGRGDRRPNRLRNSAEVWIGQVANGVGEIRVVEEVEEVRTELKASLFAQAVPQREAPGNGQVEIFQSRSIILVAARRAHSARERRREPGPV